MNDDDIENRRRAMEEKWAEKQPIPGRILPQPGQGQYFIPVNSSTAVALKTFALDPVENEDISQDLLNLEQQSFDKPRILLRTYVKNESMACKEIGLNKGRAKEEYARSTITDVLRRRDATELEAAESGALTFKFIKSIFFIWFKSKFSSSE